MKCLVLWPCLHGCLGTWNVMFTRLAFALLELFLADLGCHFCLPQLFSLFCLLPRLSHFKTSAAAITWRSFSVIYSLAIDWGLNAFSDTHSPLLTWTSIYCPPKKNLSPISPIEISHMLIVKVFETASNNILFHH